MYSENTLWDPIEDCNGCKHVGVGLLCVRGACRLGLLPMSVLELTSSWEARQTVLRWAHFIRVSACKVSVTPYQATQVSLGDDQPSFIGRVGYQLLTVQGISNIFMISSFET